MSWKDDPVVSGGGWEADPVVGEPKTSAFAGMTPANIIGGLVRGAGSIGATLRASPSDLGIALGVRDRPKTLSSLIVGDQPTAYERNRTEMDAGLRNMGADTNSWWFKGPKLAAEVAGTLGVGGAMANGMRAIPTLANKAPAFIDAVATSGMRAGGAKGLAGEMTARAAGGSLNGAASAGLVDPGDMDVGAALGGALPIFTKTFGAVGNAMGKGARAATTGTLGLATGVGSEPIKQAFRAGQMGGKNGGQAFLDNMNGNVPMTDVLDSAKQALQAMQAQKSAAYRSGMVPIKNDSTVLKFNGIDSAVNDAAAMVSFKGQVKNTQAADAVSRMRAIVDEWKALSPTDFHTPEGLDALKQKLGGELESIPFNEKTARLAASKIYNATKAEIQQQAPEYAKVMKEYQAAAEQITEIERALSLGNKAAADTSMRKLQSLMRNNVQTNYGNRLSLAKELETAGGVDLMSPISGQALSSLTPRSLAGQIGAGGVGLSALSGSLLPLAALPFQSPRLVGSAAYGAGRLSGLLSDGAQSAQGRLSASMNGLLGAPGSFEQLAFRLPGVLAADR